jgi:hypothetical protein
MRQAYLDAGRAYADATDLGQGRADNLDAMRLASLLRIAAKHWRLAERAYLDALAAAKG